MTKTEKAVIWAIEIANDPAHGYDQDNRWGPDYDCSSLVISAWQQAGVPVKTKGAYNTKSMKSVFLSCGFKDVTSSVNLDNGSGMKRGDVLLNIVSHAVMHIGNGKVVAARINENGEDHGGTPGDQDGEEIKIQNYYNFPWDCVLRYTEDSSTTDPEPQPTTGNAKIRKGQSYANKFANAAEILLHLRAYDPNGVEIPGTFGSGLLSAVKAFQKAQNLTVSGTCDRNTFLKLIN